jgi:hypothetical protein
VSFRGSLSLNQSYDPRITRNLTKENEAKSCVASGRHILDRLLNLAARWNATVNNLSPALIVMKVERYSFPEAQIKAVLQVDVEVWYRCPPRITDAAHLLTRLDNVTRLKLDGTLLENSKAPRSPG